MCRCVMWLVGCYCLVSVVLNALFFFQNKFKKEERANAWRIDKAFSKCWGMLFCPLRPLTDDWLRFASGTARPGCFQNAFLLFFLLLFCLSSVLSVCCVDVVKPMPQECQHVSLDKPVYQQELSRYFWLPSWSPVTSDIPELGLDVTLKEAFCCVVIITTKACLISEEKRRLDLDFFNQLLEQILKNEEEKRQKKKRTSRMVRVPRHKPAGELKGFCCFSSFFPCNPLSGLFWECVCPATEKKRKVYVSDSEEDESSSSDNMEGEKEKENVCNDGGSSASPERKRGRDSQKKSKDASQ